MKLNPKFEFGGVLREHMMKTQAFDLWGKTSKALDAAQAKFPGLRVETVGGEVLIVAPEGMTAEEVLTFIKSQL